MEVYRHPPSSVGANEECLAGSRFVDRVAVTFNQTGQNLLDWVYRSLIHSRMTASASKAMTRSCCLSLQ